MFRQRPYGAFREALSFKQEEITMPNVNVFFSDDFTVKEKSILAKTFTANCQHLGISGCTVLIHRKMLGPKQHQGSMAHVGPNRFGVWLNSEGFNLFDGISVLGHEAVHI